MKVSGMVSGGVEGDKYERRTKSFKFPIIIPSPLGKSLNFISFTHDVVENAAFNQRHNIIHNIAIEKKIDDVSDITSSNEDPHRPLCWLRQGSEALLLFLVQWMVEARHPFL